jgi:hypothetical protein
LALIPISLACVLPALVQAQTQVQVRLPRMDPARHYSRLFIKTSTTGKAVGEAMTLACSGETANVSVTVSRYSGTHLLGNRSVGRWTCGADSGVSTEQLVSVLQRFEPSRFIPGDQFVTRSQIEDARYLEGQVVSSIREESGFDLSKREWLLISVASADHKVRLTSNAWVILAR